MLTVGEVRAILEANIEHYRALGESDSWLQGYRNGWACIERAAAQKVKA